MQKCDPYLNTDAGTMNPAEHGEVFVTKDGAETDLDLGHYERFIDREMTRSSSLMNGQIYSRIINAEREGQYLGKTVQIIPHVTNEIQRSIVESGEGYDVHIVEIGGTVGDYESLAFIESIRQMRRRVGHENVLYVHVVYLPYLEASKELKSKPAQNTVRDLREAGVHADVLIARAERPVPEKMLEKMSLYCDVDMEGIVAMPTAKTVYEVPLILEESGLPNYISAKLGLPQQKAELTEWRKLVATIKDSSRPEVAIGVVAKYMDHEDTYMSVFEALKAAAWANGVEAKISWVDAEKLPAEGCEGLHSLDAILVPGGFGARGVEGKVLAASCAMEHNIPYLGLCYGMHMAVIALARKIGLSGANSTEVDPDTKHPVIHMMEHQRGIAVKGGTMRLGDYPCVLGKDTVSAAAYGSTEVNERHRHRWEFNNAYREQLQEAGMVLAGMSPDEQLVEVIEMRDHPFFVASQFHPEFKSRPNRPHPLFDSFIKVAALAKTGAKR